MGKYKLVLLAAVLGLSLVACNSNSAPKEASVKIGVIDTNKVFEESEAGKQGLERLTKMQDEMQVELEALQKDFEANPEDADAMLKMQQAYQLFQVRYNAEQQSLVGVLDSALLKSIENVRTKLGLDLILAKDSALAYNQNIDISKAIIEDLNSQKVELPPVQPKTAMPTLPVVPETGAAAPKADAPKADAPAAAEAPKADAKPAAEDEEQPQGMHGY